MLFYEVEEFVAVTKHGFCFMRFINNIECLSQYYYWLVRADVPLSYIYVGGSKIAFHTGIICRYIMHSYIVCGCHSQLFLS